MSNYKKPVVLMNEELSEGVYAASGDVASSEGGGLTSSDCWTAEARIHQSPETGRGDYRIQVDCKHANPGMHRSSAVVTIVFNQSVDVSWAGGGITAEVGSGSTIKLAFDIGTYNPNESKGWGDLVVTSDAGLEILDVGIQCTGK